MEAYLSSSVQYLLTQSWQIAVLTIAVAVAAFALKNRSAHIRYLLWLIVLAKCLAPPLLTIPLAVLPRVESSEPIVVSSSAEIVTLDHKVADTALVTPLKRPSVSVEAISASIVTDRATRKTVREWVAIAWMVGAGVYLIMNLLRALRTNLWLWRKRQALSAKLQTDIENLLSTYNFKKFPKIYLIDDISQPFVWGLLRGSIYLRTSFLNLKSQQHKRNVLGHELCHILRFDAAVNLLQVIAQAVFWFHPFVWWANKRIRAEREKCCDEMAIARIGATPKDYSTAIVNILVSEYESTRPVPSLAIAGPVKNIEERIKAMLRPRKKFYKRPSLIAATIVLLLALLTVPTALVLTVHAEAKTATESGDKPTKTLHQAAAEGNIEQVKKLIAQGADVNAKDEPMRTALHYASEKGHTEVARLLISSGAYVNASSWNGMTPLHCAAVSGDRQTIELLLSKGADINARDRHGRTPVLEAVKSPVTGRKEVVELLIAKGAKVPALHFAAYMADMEKLKKYLQEGIDINSQADDGSTALHAAACSGKKDIVEFLISKGANVDAKDNDRVTPLYYAATHNYEDIADLLLAKGDDVNAKDKDGRFTLLYYAIWEHSKDAIKLLISKGANVNVKDGFGYTPLVYAIWEDDKDMVELLIDKGADVNAEDNDGLTPYYWSAMQGSKDLVELLAAKGATPVFATHLAARAGDLTRVKKFVDEGADINAKDKGAGALLFSAVLADNTDVAKFFISKGADVNVKDSVGRTPLHTVILYRGKKDMVELLISKGADVNAREKWGVTPLHIACRRGQKDVAELLIAKGADLNAKITDSSIPSFGMTPLYYAVIYGRTEVVKLLIAKGADINIKDNDSQTPLHLACLRGHKDVVELLIDKGADINVKDNKQQTPLSLAKERGHDEIAELLRKHGAEE